MPDPVIQPSALPDLSATEYTPPIHRIPPTRWVSPGMHPNMEHHLYNPQQAADQLGPAGEIPYGPVQGQQQLRTDYNNLGNIRPFGPGERVIMPNGDTTSEETWTIELQPGQWTVVPGLWIVNGVPTHVDPDQAKQYALQSGLMWPYTYPTEEQANQYADQREMLWNMFQGDTTKQPPLWSRPWPPR
jgi:hypothetical protein